MGVRCRIIVLAIVQVALLTAAGAAGQPVGAGASDGAGHAWVTIHWEGDDGATLAHLAPRSVDGAARPSPDGRLARAGKLSRKPSGLAASGDLVFVLMGPGPSGAREVGAVHAHAVGLRDLWRYEPEGRVEVLPSIGPGVAVLGFAAFARTPYALVSGDDSVGLLRLDGLSWEAVSPAPPVRAGGPLRLAADGGGVVVIERAADEVLLHRHVPDGWVTDRVPGEGLAEDLRIVGLWRGELVMVSSGAGSGDGGVSSVVTAGKDGVRWLGVAPFPSEAAVGVVGSSGRLVAVWNAPRPADEDGALAGGSGFVQHVVEFSLVTGTVLFDGVASTAAPISVDDVRMLAGMLIAMTALVLIAVMRPGPEPAEPVLPPMTAFAPAGRRMLATAIDLLPAWFLASRGLGLSMIETLGPIALPITGSMSVLPPLVILALAASHAAVSEMVFGRSLGKAMTGLFVARVDASPGPMAPGQFRPPTPGGAVLRNAVKWFLFPAATLALGDRSGRHRGDLMARTAVLTGIAETS